MENLKPLNELISLKGKRALVTGSASGIGKAMALRLGEAGAALELVDIDLDGLSRIKKELSKFKVEINIHKVDLSKKQEIDDLWKKIDKRTPDILVNNAGIYPFKNFLEIDEKFLKKVVDIDLNSVFWMCQNMIRRRLKKGGVIINVGSIECILPFAEGMAAYNISKLGVVALTRTLAKEYAKKGFRVNVIIPGGINTQGTKKVARSILKFKPNLLKLGFKFRLRVPAGRMGDPDEVARTTLFLASDLSTYIHGALIPVDGGYLSN